MSIGGIVDWYNALSEISNFYHRFFYGAKNDGCVSMINNITSFGNKNHS